MRDRAAERRKKLRTFGLILGLLLAVVGWRARVKGHPAAAVPLWVLALSATATAWAAPDKLDAVERRWMAAAKLIGKINTFIVLTIVYYFILTPFAVVMRMISGDPLDRAWGSGSYWKKRTSGEDLTSYERQF
jgi:hypothetical protein